MKRGITSSSTPQTTDLSASNSSGASSITRHTRVRNALAVTIQPVSECAPLRGPHSGQNFRVTGILTRGYAEVAKTPNLVATAVKTAAQRLLVAVKK